MKKEILFCQSGGCTAKLGAGVLERILSRLPKGQVDPHLLIGYDSHDDAAVYQVSDDLAIVQTLDFFPPMVEDPYIFGQIAVANALSDVYAMGGEVKTALNIVCFDEKMDLNVLGQILQGGSEKVQEAGGSLVGGHSIADNGVKYGLSVMGTIDPRRIYANNALCCSDVLILTKKLGVGIVCCASRVQMASQKALDEAIASMTTLNKYAAEVAKNYNIHACSDVTGFGLLGHLHEMLDGKFSCQINTANILTIEGAKEYASEFLITAAAQKNRNHVESFVEFHDIDFAMEEILFDPQTSGGLLFSLAKDEAQDFLSELKAKGIDAFIVGEIIEKAEKEIYVEEK